MLFYAVWYDFQIFSYFALLSFNPAVFSSTRQGEVLVDLDFNVLLSFISSYADSDPSKIRELSMFAATTDSWWEHVQHSTDSIHQEQAPRLNCLTPRAQAISTVCLGMIMTFCTLLQMIEWTNSLAIDVPSDMHLSSRSGLVRRSKSGSSRQMLNLTFSTNSLFTSCIYSLQSIYIRPSHK